MIIIDTNADNKMAQQFYQAYYGSPNYPGPGQIIQTGGYWKVLVAGNNQANATSASQTFISDINAAAPSGQCSLVYNNAVIINSNCQIDMQIVVPSNATSFEMGEANNILSALQNIASRYKSPP